MMVRLVLSKNMMQSVEVDVVCKVEVKVKGCMGGGWTTGPAKGQTWSLASEAVSKACVFLESYGCIFWRVTQGILRL